MIPTVIARLQDHCHSDASQEEPLNEISRYGIRLVSLQLCKQLLKM